MLGRRSVRKGVEVAGKQCDEWLVKQHIAIVGPVRSCQKGMHQVTAHNATNHVTNECTGSPA